MTAYCDHDVLDPRGALFLEAIEFQIYDTIRWVKKVELNQRFFNSPKIDELKKMGFNSS